MAKYLDHSQHNLITMGGAALGAAIMLYGANDIRTPDYPVTDALVQGVYQSGQKWEAAPPVVEDIRYRLRGTLIGVLGLGVLGASVMHSSKEPFSVAPESGRNFETEEPLLTTNASPKRLKATFISRVKAMLDECPELLTLLRAPVILVVGGQGSGKSTFCAVLSLLRSLLEGDELAILDPHYSHNKAMGYIPWLSGDIYDEHEAIRAQAIASTEIRQAAQPFRTTIFDEFSNWGGSHQLAGEQNAIVASATQDIRKSKQRYINILHGLEKEMVCPNADTGRHKSLLTQAVVVRLESKTNRYGEFEPAGYMQFNPSGKACPTEGKIGKQIALPQMFLPPNDRGWNGLGSEIEALLDTWSMKARDQTERFNPISPEIEEYTKRINRHDERTREILNKVLETQSGISTDESENVHQGEFAWTDHPMSLNILRLVKYCFDKRDKLIEENGGISVRKLSKNWARHQDMSGSEFSNLLDVTVFYNVGAWVDDENKFWRPCIDPGNLPDESDL